MSTICKLDPGVRIARRARRNRAAWHQGQANLATIEGRFHLQASMVLNELRRDPRRTGEAKIRAYTACMTKFAKSTELEREAAKLKIAPSASTPLRGLASPKLKIAPSASTPLRGLASPAT